MLTAHLAPLIRYPALDFILLVPLIFFRKTVLQDPVLQDRSQHSVLVDRAGNSLDFSVFTF